MNKTYRFKIVTIGVLFLLVCATNFAQSNNETLKHIDSLTLKMFNDMNNRNYDGILEMTHPKVFEILPKETMKTVIKSTFEGNEEFSINIPKIVPEYKLSEIFTNETDSINYAFASYDLKMEMTFHKQDFDEESKDMMKTMMKSKGMDVTFLTDNTMSVLMNDRITIVLKDNTTNNKWVMINYDPDSPLFYQIVPGSIQDSAKNYKQNLMAETSQSAKD